MHSAADQGHDEGALRAAERDMWGLPGRPLRASSRRWRETGTAQAGGSLRQSPGHGNMLRIKAWRIWARPGKQQPALACHSRSVFLHRCIPRASRTPVLSPDLL